MNLLPKNSFAALGALLLTFALWTGCVTTGSNSGTTVVETDSPPPPTLKDLLRPEDLVTLIYSGVPMPPEKHEERIKDDGNITLYLVGAVKAVGKTAGELQKEIHDLYVPKYYKHLNVVVLTENRYFYVDGSVKIPSRLPHLGELTVLKAITAAGGFTDFANKKKVQVVRANGQKLTVDCLKALKDPKLDLPIYPGDKITVPQRYL